MSKKKDYQKIHHSKRKKKYYNLAIGIGISSIILLSLFAIFNYFYPIRNIMRASKDTFSTTTQYSVENTTKYSNSTMNTTQTAENTIDTDQINNEATFVSEEIYEQPDSLNERSVDSQTTSESAEKLENLKTVSQEAIVAYYKNYNRTDYQQALELLTHLYGMDSSNNVENQVYIDKNLNTLGQLVPNGQFPQKISANIMGGAGGPHWKYKGEEDYDVIMGTNFSGKYANNLFADAK